jgi:PKD repeat protein
MKKILFLIAACISILSITGCKKDPPVALFSTGKEAYKMGETVTFTNQSESAKEYAWDFGDGETSILENPTHIFESAGDFAVTLTATNNGGTHSFTDSLTILADLTGFWNKSLTFQGGGGGGGGFNNFKNCTMNVAQHEDNTLTGSLVYQNGERTATFLSTSKIVGNAVTINWDSPAYKFKGNVSASGTTMVGTFTGSGGAGGGGSGTWTATKL